MSIAGIRPEQSPLSIPEKGAWQRDPPYGRALQHSRASRSYERSLGQRWLSNPFQSLSPLAARFGQDEDLEGAAPKRDEAAGSANEIQSRKISVKLSVDPLEDPDPYGLFLAQADKRRVPKYAFSMAPPRPLLDEPRSSDLAVSRIRRFWTASPKCPIPTLHLEVLGASKTLRDRLKRQSPRHPPEHCDGCNHGSLFSGFGPLHHLLHLTDKVLAKSNLTTSRDMNDEALAIKTGKLEILLPPRTPSNELNDDRIDVLNHLLNILDHAIGQTYQARNFPLFTGTG